MASNRTCVDRPCCSYSRCCSRRAAPRRWRIRPTGPAPVAPAARRSTSGPPRSTEAWRPGPDWSTGYVPLEGPTVLTGDPRFTPDTEAAYLAGWYRAQVPIPPTRVGGEIRFPDGRLTLPLVSAAEAYRQLDQGDPLPCPGRPKRTGRPTPGGPTVEPGPDGWATSSATQTACLSLTVTGVTFGARAGPYEPGYGAGPGLAVHHQGTGHPGGPARRRADRCHARSRALRTRPSAGRRCWWAPRTSRRSTTSG